MVKYKEAIKIAERLIADNGHGFDYQCYRKVKNTVSSPAKHMAIRVLDNNPLLAENLRKAIGENINCKVHMDWIYRVYALVIDDITLQMLEVAKKLRTQMGMPY